jgi:hypothetical protein
MALEPVLSLPHASEFFEEFNAFMTEFMDVTYGAERLQDRPDLLLHTLLELAADVDQSWSPRLPWQSPVDNHPDHDAGLHTSGILR